MKDATCHTPPTSSTACAGLRHTIHKAQGSEYPAVVVVIANAHYPMLARNLLYTAITRGKRLVVLVTERRALRMGRRGRDGPQALDTVEEKLSA